ncbi:MAG: YihY/virulence factor BrkB family protein [Candidatus Promineifilaceae bacterium]
MSLPAALKDAAALLVRAVKKWQADRAPRMAAALAYYTLVSLAPLIIILSTFVRGLLRSLVGAGEFVRQVETLTGRIGLVMGADVAAMLNSLVGDLQRPVTLTLTALVGLGVLLWGASNIFSQLHESLNIIWGVRVRPGEGIWSFLRLRLRSFLALALAGLLAFIFFLVTAVFSIAGPVLQALFPGLLPDLGWLSVMQFGLAFVLSTVLFAIIYNVMPERDVPWHDVWLGALVTAGLTGLGLLILSLYFRLRSFGSIFGAAGSLMVLLLWTYYTAQIFLFGAEFTHVLTTREAEPDVAAGR